MVAKVANVRIIGTIRTRKSMYLSACTVETLFFSARNKSFLRTKLYFPRQETMFSSVRNYIFFRKKLLFPPWKTIHAVFNC